MEQANKKLRKLRKDKKKLEAEILQLNSDIKNLDQKISETNDN